MGTCSHARSFDYDLLFLPSLTTLKDAMVIKTAMVVIQSLCPFHEVYDDLKIDVELPLSPLKIATISKFASGHLHLRFAAEIAAFHKLNSRKRIFETNPRLFILLLPISRLQFAAEIRFPNCHCEKHFFETMLLN
jgi:hypothetical protein